MQASMDNLESKISKILCDFGIDNIDPNALGEYCDLKLNKEEAIKRTQDQILEYIESFPEKGQANDMIVLEEWLHDLEIIAVQPKVTSKSAMILISKIKPQLDSIQKLLTDYIK